MWREYMHKYETEDLFQKVTQLSEQFKPRTWAIKDEYGQSATELRKCMEAILWKASAK